MKVLDILQEGISDIVYHFTSVSNAIKILQSNTFSLTSAMAKSAEQEYVKNHYFYLSTARSKLGRYGYNGSEMVCFVLDGRKLRQNYSGEAVDYWVQRHRGESEAEDRLWTSQAYIKDANRYIISVDAFFNDERKNVHAIGNMRGLVQAANQASVPVKFYNTKQDFIASKRPIDAETYLSAHAKEGPSEKPYVSRLTPGLIPYIDAMKGINLDDEKVSRLIYLIRNYPQDTFPQLKASAHNDSTTDAMRELTRLAIRFKLKNLKEIADYLNNKYKR